MKRLNIGQGFRLPAEAVTQTFGILAKRGVGKTYTASVMVEEMLRARLHVVVTDPVGVWWGLRSSADGKRPGFPILVLGGEHGDLPLEETAGELVANLVVEDGVSAILDLSLLRKGQQVRFMTEFAERLYHRNRAPLHLALDEADAFAPQRPQRGHERMLGAIEDLVRRGRARGIGVTLITQRAAVLNKDVLTQVEVLVAMRTIAPQDRDAIDAWIRVHGTPQQREKLMASLPSLPVGTAWFWSPGWLDVFQQVRVRTRETFDSSATPKLGQRTRAPKALAEINIEALKKWMESTVERARANDPRELRRRIAELQKQLAARPKPVAGPKRIEVQVIDEKQIVRLGKAVYDFAKLWLRALDVSERIQADIKALQQTILAARLPAAASTPHLVPPPRHLPPRGISQGEPRPRCETGALRTGELRMLQVLAQFRHLDGLTRDQLALLSGYTRSGTFDTYASTLRRTGLAVAGDGRLRVTEEGLLFLGSKTLTLPPPSTSKELIELFSRKLRTGERRMLDLLVQTYPDGMTTDELAAKSGYTRSGTFDTYVSKLRRNLLLVRDGTVLRANETLFMGGA